MSTTAAHQHTGECLVHMQERRQERELWLHQWPNHCCTCKGDGFLIDEGKDENDFPIPYDCPDCILEGICARCGSDQPDLHLTLVCSSCGWEFDEHGAPWVAYCTCGAAVPADAVGLLDTPMGVLLEVMT